MKRILSKVVGKKLVTFQELEEVILDVECIMNNCPLCYQGEEFEEQVITPKCSFERQTCHRAGGRLGESPIRKSAD